LARPLVAGRFFAGGSALACRLCRRSRRAWSGRAAGHPLAGGVDQGLGQYTFRPLGQDIVLPRRAGFPVPLLDQQPLLLVAAATQAGAHQCPVPGQFLADQGELELAVAVGLCRIPVGLPDAAIPDDDITAAVLPLGDAALEVAVAQGVILDVYCQALVCRIQAGPLGHRPADQSAIQLQAKVVMQIAGGMLLDDETQGSIGRTAVPGGLPRWFLGFLEVPLAVVLGKRSGHGQFARYRGCDAAALSGLGPLATFAAAATLAFGLATQTALEQLGQVHYVGGLAFFVRLLGLHRLDLARL